jgi:hypothetical protein
MAERINGVTDNLSVYSKDWGVVLTYASFEHLVSLLNEQSTENKRVDSDKVTG